MSNGTKTAVATLCLVMGIVIFRTVQEDEPDTRAVLKSAQETILSSRAEPICREAVQWALNSDKIEDTVEFTKRASDLYKYWWNHHQAKFIELAKLEQENEEFERQWARRNADVIQTLKRIGLALEHINLESLKGIQIRESTEWLQRFRLKLKKADG